jgi:hypothetical protein
MGRAGWRAFFILPLFFLRFGRVWKSGKKSCQEVNRGAKELSH